MIVFKKWALIWTIRGYQY